MNKNFLFLDGVLPKSIRNGNIYTLYTDQKLALLKQSADQNCKLSVLPIEPKRRKEFLRDANFERTKYEKYIPLLSSKLGLIHRMEKPDIFWERIMGYTLLMHISHCRRLFKVGNIISSKNVKVINTALTAKNLAYIPIDEVGHRHFFQHTNGGDEQLFHIYRSIFHNKLLNISSGLSENKVIEEIPLLYSSSINRTIVSRITSLWRNRAIILHELALRLIPKIIAAKVLAIGVIWDRKKQLFITLSSRGRFQLQNFIFKYNVKKISINTEARKILSKTDQSFDEFDIFFFTSLYFAAPLTWVERFSDRFTQACSFLDKFPKLTYLINETLDEDSLIIMAEASDRNIKIFHTEHNFMQQQFLGNVVWYIERKVDKYLTLGWRSTKSKKIIPAGSYFNWTKTGDNKIITIPILYIAGTALVKPPLTSTGYSEQGSINVKKYIKQKEVFFNSLSSFIKKQIYYRDYPKFRRINFKIHFLDPDFLSRYSQQFNHIDNDGKINTTDLISRCKILIVDYLSTPWLQGLLANVPMIVLFNTDSYYLDDEYLNFFDDLINVGIFQKNPVAAAAFLTSIINNPDIWWESHEVQSARKKFLDQNFGGSDGLTYHLHSLCR